MKQNLSKRNPVAKAVRRIRPKVLPDKRRKLLAAKIEEEPMSSENPLDEFIPKNPIMAGAWLGSVRYALGRDDIMAAFRNDTGFHWTPGKSVIDRMVDDATGVPVAFLRAFAKWHNENIWGEEGGEPIDAPGATDT